MVILVVPTFVILAVCRIVSYRIGVEDAGLKPLCPPLYNIL